VGGTKGNEGGGGGRGGHDALILGKVFLRRRVGALDGMWIAIEAEVSEVSASANLAMEFVLNGLPMMRGLGGEMMAVEDEGGSDEGPQE